MAALLDRGISQADLDRALAMGREDPDRMAELSIKFYTSQEYEANTADVRGTVSRRMTTTSEIACSIFLHFLGPG